MKKLVLAVLGFAVLSFTACEKESMVKENTLPESIEDMVSLEATLDDISEAADYEVDYFSSSDEAVLAINESSALKSSGPRFGHRYKINQCPNVTILSEEGGFPKTITLDYGEGTELANGRVLSGKIIITISASLKTDGATRSVTYEEFFVDSVGLSGLVSSVLSYKPSFYRYFTITGEKILTFPNGESVVRTIEKKREWIWGIATPLDHSDDEVNITGSVTTVCSWGDDYLREIVNPLVKKGDCKYIVQGMVEFSKNGALIASLDYGPGTCDQLAKVTKDGVTKEIKIGKKKRRIR